MGVPIIFLIIAPLAGIIALQLTPPFSSIAVILSLAFSACGLVLLYKHLLLPLRKLTTAVSQSGCADTPPLTAACDLVCALEDSLNARDAALRHEIREARETIEKLQYEIQELREKRAATIQAQHSALEALRKAQADLNAAAALHGHGQISNIISDLRQGERILLHSGQFWDENESAVDGGQPDQVDAFPWKGCYDTGIPVLDGQHKLLLSYINRLHSGMQNGCSNTLLLGVLDDLTGYAFTHFATEESFFSRSAYPLTERHIREHQKFRETITQLRDAVLDGKAFIDIALLEYLKNWLVGHIQNMDAMFAPYVTGVDHS